MSGRRNFIKTLVALPVVAKTTATSAEPESSVWKNRDVQDLLYEQIKVTCPHCFELAGRGHACDELVAWELENES